MSDDESAVARYLLPFVNARIKERMIFNGLHLRGDTFYAYAGRRDYAVVCDGQMRMTDRVYRVYVRSVLCRRSSGGYFAWSPNGQAGRGAREIAWWPEGEFVVDIPMDRLPLALQPTPALVALHAQLTTR